MLFIANFNILPSYFSLTVYHSSKHTFTIKIFHHNNVITPLYYFMQAPCFSHHFFVFLCSMHLSWVKHISLQCLFFHLLSSLYPISTLLLFPRLLPYFPLSHTSSLVTSPSIFSFMFPIHTLHFPSPVLGISIVFQLYFHYHQNIFYRIIHFQ